MNMERGDRETSRQQTECGFDVTPKEGERERVIEGG
jgi:hypothetical protein